MKSGWTFADATATLWIDGDPYIPDDFNFVGFTMANVNLEPNFAVMKTTATFTFYGIGTIVVETTGKIFDLYTPDQYVVQRGIGWGTDQLEGVKIDIKQSGEGTIMGLNADLFP